MARKVQRKELLDYQTYNDTREQTRAVAMRVKAIRRIHVGEVLTFLFENADTTRYQIQEMMLVERIARETDIVHELHTYNATIGEPGEVGCTLLIELTEERVRAEKLNLWLDLPNTLYIRCADGTLVRPHFDPAQVGEARLSSVQYLKFNVGDRHMVSVGCDFDDPMLKHETMLSPAELQALHADLHAKD